MLRDRGHTVLLVLRDRDTLAGFCAFDPDYSGAYPFVPANPTCTGALLHACHRHAHHDRFDYVRVSIERDRAIYEQLRAAGAELTFELLRLAGSV